LPPAPCASDLTSTLLTEFRAYSPAADRAPMYTVAVAHVIDAIGPQFTGCPASSVTGMGNFMVVSLKRTQGNPFEVVITFGGQATLIDPTAITPLSAVLADPTLIGVSGMWANASLADAGNRRAFLYVLSYENGSDRLMLRTAPQPSFEVLPAPVSDLASEFGSGRGYLEVQKEGATTYLVKAFDLVGNQVGQETIVVDGDGNATASGYEPAYPASTSPQLPGLLDKYPNGSEYMANGDSLCKAAPTSCSFG